MDYNKMEWDCRRSSKIGLFIAEMKATNIKNA